VKKIGIIGGLSAESTFEYYKIIVREYNKRKGGVSSPLIVIDSLDLQQISDLMEKSEWGEVKNHLVNSAQNLVNAGAEVIILATNTPHMVFNDLIKEVTVPMISIMDATAEKIQQQNINKVVLLGTKYTMQASFYPETLKKYNIEIITPELEDQLIINDIIWKELAHHIITNESKQAYLDVISKLKSKGAQGVILGCTEIPLLIKQEDSPIPVFDTTTIHALKVLNYAMD